MNGRAETPVARLLHLLRSHAAQSGPFRPADAVHAAGPEATSDPLVLAEALSKLHAECSVTPGPEGDLWLYRPEMRRKMQTLSPPVATPEGPPDSAIAEAQAGRGDFAPRALERLIATLTEPDRLASLAVTLERAGPQAPGHALLVRLRSALNAARDRSRSDHLLAQGFFGRGAELSALAAWIGRPGTGLPAQALLVSGAPGIGKTLLMERAIQQARDLLDPVLIRLDFERPALGTGEDGALLEEISRQVADSLPGAAAEMRDLRLAAAEERVRVERGSGRRYLPRDLLAGIVRAIRGGLRPVLVLLDTLDVLQGRGATYPDALMASFDRMVEAGMPDMRIIAAGRGQVFLDHRARVAEQVPLVGLADPQARQMLAARGVSRTRWSRILSGARGNPLLLALEAGAEPERGAGEADPEGIAAPVAAAYLHRAILGRLPEDLRQAALASLVLPRIDAPTVMSVIAPATGKAPDAEASARLLAGLGEQAWLTDHDGAALVFRADMRAALLGPICAAHPALVAEVEARSIRGLAGPHRRKTARAGGAAPGLEQVAAARREPEAAGASAPKARRAVPSVARGPMAAGVAPAPGSGPWLRLDSRRGRLVDVPVPSEHHSPPDAAMLDSLAGTLGSGAAEEAAHLLAQGLTGAFAADSPEGRLVLAHLWLTGQWAQARRLFRAQPAAALDRALAESPHLIGRILLEIWAEFRFARLRARLRDPAFRASTARALTEAGRIALRGGALDFAVIAASDGAAPPAGVEEGQDALAARMHGVAPARVAAARAAAATLREGFGLGFAVHDSAPMPEPPWEAGAHIAPLNPYDGPLRALVAAHDRRGGSVVTRRLTGLSPVLPELAELFAPGVATAWGLPERVTAHAPGLVDALGAMGLTAEWSGGVAAVTRQADLPLIARAAERWRRTVCGVWSYPSDPPVGWTGIPLPDWGSRHLAAIFAADVDAPGRARRALSIWSSGSGAGPVRWPGRVRPAEGPPEAVLSDLLRRGHPASVAVPMAILAVGSPPATDAPAKSLKR